MDNETKPTVSPPDGFRLLERGEAIRKGDLYCRGPGHSWKESRTGGGRWNADGFWPMARRLDARRDKGTPKEDR